MPETIANDEKLLSVIIPITQMAGRMGNLDTWLSKSVNLDIGVVFVHDIQDPFTANELEDLVNKHNQLDIRVFEGNFGSPGLARNFGLKSSLAHWIAFWDSDDIPNPQGAIAAINQANPRSEVIIGNFSTNVSGEITTFEHKGQLKNVALNPGLWRMIIKTSALQGVNFCSTRMGEDQLFLIDLNLESRKIHFSSMDLYQYFQGSPMQLTSNQRSINEVEKTLSLAIRRLRNDPRLRNSFSEIVLLRLLTTTIFRTHGIGKLKLIINFSGVIFQSTPSALLGYFWSLKKIQVKKK